MKSAIRRAEYPCLVVPGSDGREVRHPILGREASVGRESGNDICIPDPLVSKQHAKIIVANHSVTVFDLGSANKTRVNGQIVSQSTVRYGDELQFARIKCRLVLAGPLEPLEEADAIGAVSEEGRPV